MRVIRFETSDGPHIGVLTDEGVVDVSACDPHMSRDLTFLLKQDAGLSAIRHLLRNGHSNPLRLGNLALLTPIEASGKFICLGLNYVDHVAESKHGQQAYPTLFMRARSSLLAAEQSIIRPIVSEQLDYEAELAVIVGRTMRHVSPEEALDGVAGYTCFNDVSVRDFQRHTVQWTMGKNFDATGPLGPTFVTADELPRGASGLSISTRVDGVTLQANNTANMIFSVAASLSYISKGMTLEPGDVIAMGTPSGVAHAHKPPKWLRHGQSVEVEIERIGILRNDVVDEQSQVTISAA
jgi:acylpyruvate hydrolase